MGLTKEQAKKLLEVIDAKIASAGPQNGADEGLTDAIRERKLTDELLDLCNDEEEE